VPALLRYRVTLSYSLHVVIIALPGFEWVFHTPPQFALQSVQPEAMELLEIYVRYLVMCVKEASTIPLHLTLGPQTDLISLAYNGVQVSS
jgi:hypothetical protein